MKINIYIVAFLWGRGKNQRGRFIMAVHSHNETSPLVLAKTRPLLYNHTAVAPMRNSKKKEVTYGRRIKETQRSRC